MINIRQSHGKFFVGEKEVTPAFISGPHQVVGIGFGNMSVDDIVESAVGKPPEANAFTTDGKIAIVPPDRLSMTGASEYIAAVNYYLL